MASSMRAGGASDPHKFVLDGQPSIPWLPASKVVPLLQHTLTRRHLTNECSHSRKNKVEAFEIFGQSFPFYLPARYHTMDIKSIHKNSVDGSYWKNAFAFLSLMTDRATMPYYILREGPAVSLPVMAGTEMCETASEFLFEPWVLLQLPFQPALLHQWAVAAYAESLIFSKRLVEIGSRGYAPQFHDLYTQLAELSVVLSNNCNLLITNFFEIYCESLVENVHVKAERVFVEQRPDVLAETLAILEFVLSDDCGKIFNFIKISSWTGEHSPIDLIHTADCSGIGAFLYSEETHNHSYDDYSWQVPLCDRCPESKILRQPYIAVVESATGETLTKKCLINVANKINPKATKDYIKNKILENGHIRGFKSIDNFLEHFESILSSDELLAFNENLAAISSHKKVKHGPDPKWIAAGVMYQILSLQAELYMEHAQGTLARLVWRAAKKFDEGVHFKAGEEEPKLMDLNTLLEQVGKVKSHKEKWSFKSLFRRAEESCSSPQSETNTGGTYCLISTYTKRIRLIVLQMHKEHFELLHNNKQPFRYNPEVPFVQYILPCVIATYLDVITESQSTESIEFYTKFMALAVGSYKKYSFNCYLDSHKKHFIHNKETFCQEYETKEIFLNTYLKKYFKNSRKLNAVVKKITNGILVDKTVPVCSRSQGEFFLPTDFQTQVWWGLCRLNWRIQTIRDSFNFSMVEVISALGFIENFTPHENLMIAAYKDHCDKSKGQLRKEIEKMCRSNNIPKLKARHLQELSFHQLFSISLYQAWTAWSTKFETDEDAQKFFDTHDNPDHQFDILHSLISLFLNKDYEEVILFIYYVYEAPPGAGERLMHIPLEVAKKNLCCEPLLKKLTAEGKVQMDQPGQCTFFPIQHCRWCGLVHTSDLRLCVECKDEPDFEDPHYFCSDVCEKNAIDSYHNEEHASFVERQLKIK